MLMLYSWVAFWLVFLIGGLYFYNHKQAVLLPNTYVSDEHLLKTVSKNALLSLLFVPFTELIPTLIVVPNSLVGYMMRVVLALVIGEAIFYTSHRLLHHPKLYHYHKMHHTFISPHPIAGLYASQLEYFVSNHLSMVIPLKMISCYNPYMLMLESAIIATNIAKSHSGQDSIYTGSPIHQIHHNENVYNFGFLYIFDYIFGTLKLK